MRMRNLAFALHGVGGVVDQVGPDLVQLAAVGADPGQAAVVFADQLHAVLELVVEHHERAFEAVMDVDLLLGCLVHVGVLFHGLHQFRDAPGARFDVRSQAVSLDGGGGVGEKVA